MAPRKLAFGELASLIALLLWVFPAQLLLFVITTVVTKDRALFRIRNATVRIMTRLLSVTQLQFLFPGTLTAYRRFARSRRFQPVIEGLPAVDGEAPDTHIMWLGDAWTEGKRVVLYLHGGGFAMPLMKGHLQYLDWVKTRFSRTDFKDNVCIAILQYTISPERRYPYPLVQAVRATASLLNRGVPPSCLIIGGDSAGGHIALSVVSHILNPHPSVPFLSLTEPLAGMFLLSPAVKISSASSDSFKRNAEIDMLHRRVCQNWTKHFTEGTEFYGDLTAGNYWGEAAPAPANWWTGIQTVTKKLLITGGREELLIDDIMTFMEKMEEVALHEEGRGSGFVLETMVGEGEIHDAALLDFMLYHGRISATTRRSAEFMLNAFLDSKPPPVSKY